MAGVASSDGYDYDFAAARYNLDGSLDTSFDGDGQVATDFGYGSSDYGFSIAIQSDGKIIVAGGSSGDIALARYNPDGSLDTSFGRDGNGKVIADSGRYARGNSVAIQSNGKIVVAGYTDSSLYGTDLAIVRFNANGRLDGLFGDGGGVIIDLGTDDFGSNVALQADGKIVVVGYTQDESFVSDLALVRCNPDGSMDTSFDSDGIVIADFYGNDSMGSSVAIQSDGKIVVVGSASGSNNWDFALARYNQDGSLDTSFGSDGLVTTGLGGDDIGKGIALQSDGRIVAAGYVYTGSNSDFAVARYNAEDGTFTYNPNSQFEALTASQVVTDTFTYVVTDGVLTDTATVSITVLGVNDAPVLGAIGDKSVDELATLVFTATATDPEVPTETLTFSLDSGSVGSINSTSGEYTWTPTEAQGPGAYTATVHVTDNGTPPLSDAETITITVNEVNAAPGVPVLLAPPNGTVTTTHPITFEWQAGAGDSPDGYNLQLDSGDGNIALITTTATTSATLLPVGVYTWTVRAFNAAGYSDWTPAWTVEIVRFRVYLPVLLRNS